MPRIVESTVYQFDELSDAAKEKARAWWREHVFSDSSDWEFVYEDAARIADLFGLDIRTRRVNLMGGGHRYEPCIYFSGFWSQGDGACFEGSYRYKKGALSAVLDYAPKDEKLHRIVKGLQDIQAKYFYSLTARAVHSGHYNHSGCMRVEVQYNRDDSRDICNAEDEVTQLLRDFADWIYGQLEAEYNYQSSDDVVDENIRANEYEFTEEGDRA